jgi:tripartite-type tricarboxylate transporter receptor subunit TctC
MTHVPYRGTLPGLTDVISGRIPFMFTDLISGLGAMQVGNVRSIFAGTAERLALLPDIPSAKEAGLNDFNAASWLGVAVPGHTPLPIHAKLHDDLVSIVQSADFKATVFATEWCAFFCSIIQHGSCIRLPSKVLFVARIIFNIEPERGIGRCDGVDPCVIGTQS